MPTVIPKVEFYYDPDHDTNDGNPWSDMDIEDLGHHLKNGGTVESARACCAAEGRKRTCVKRPKIDLGLIKPEKTNG